jgi:hypothetical protein
MVIAPVNSWFFPVKDVDFPCNIFPCTSPWIPGDGSEYLENSTWHFATMAIIELSIVSGNYVCSYMVMMIVITITVYIISLMI